MADTMVSMRFISDPRHGWGEIPTALVQRFRVALRIELGYSEFPGDDKYCYLEEDAEMYAFDKVCKRAKLKTKFIEQYVEDFDAWLYQELKARRQKRRKK